MEDFMQNPNLDGESFYLPGNNNSYIFLVHGFTATTVEVRPLAEYLNSNGGFHVYAPLLPGHGTTPSDLNSKTWMDWVDSIEGLITNVIDEYPNVFIGGESMGGVLACLLASKFPKIKKVILFSPAMHVNNLGFSRVVRFFKDYIPKASANKKEDHNKFPWQGYKVHPTSGAFQLLKLQKTTKRFLNSISQPVLIFNGLLDKTISLDSSQMVFNKINSQKKELVHLQNSGHTIILDQEFDFVARKTLDFISTM